MRWGTEGTAAGTAVYEAHVKQQLDMRPHVPFFNMYTQDAYT